MTSITTRAGKGSPLTHNEVDANFTNLNNDKLDTAGIALGSAASPTLKFTGDANTGIYSPGADQLAVATNGTGRLFVDASGNVGVGASPSVKLYVYGASASNEIRSDNGSVTSQWYQDPNGYGVFGTVSNHAQVFRTNSTERLRIDSSGNVGIGTSAPAAKLQVATGTNDYTAAANTLAVVGPSGTGLYIGTHYDGSGAGTDLVARGYSSTMGDFRFISLNGSYASPTERLRITSAGLVGIGTSSPSADLHVAGTSILFRGGAGTVSRSLELGSVASAGGTSTSDILLATYGGNNGSRIRGTGSYDFNAGTAITFGTSPTSGGGIVDRVTINSAGNVGIGTTSPTTLLDVNADTVRVRTARTPASASATGATGEICWDANYIYVCTATNTWKRSALSTW